MTDGARKYCRLCGRELKNPDSIQKGFGPGCYKKYTQNRKRGTLLEFKGQAKNISNQEAVPNS